MRGGVLLGKAVFFAEATNLEWRQITENDFMSALQFFRSREELKTLLAEDPEEWTKLVREAIQGGVPDGA